jgi:hypothetical protein
MDVKTTDYSVKFTCTEHLFGDVTIYSMAADRNTFLRFHSATNACQTTLGAWYMGALRVVEAEDPSIVGTQYTGFVDFTPDHMDKHAPRTGWMNCVADAPVTWLCVHSDGQYKRVAMEPFDGADAYTADGVTFYLGK